MALWFRIYTALTIPFVVGVVILTLIHPLLHGIEGGSLDAALPMLDLAACACGGERALTWAHRWTHRKHHDHD